MSRVFMHYDQPALDAQYDQATLVPDISGYRRRWAAGGEDARARLDVVLDLAYGDTPAETLDLYRPAGADRRPVHVYFHGGAWRALDKADGGFVAPLLVGAGAVFVSAGFALVPAVRLPEQVRQARAALAWLHRNVARFGGDPDRIHVSGHSSGAHLVGCLVADGWHATFGVPPDVVKGALAASGVFDLEPVRLSARNRYLGLSPEEAARLSPIRHVPKGRAPRLAVLWGAGELDEFRRQSRAFAEAWAAAGHPVDAEEVAGANHFDMSDLFAVADSPLGRRLTCQLTA